MTTRTLAEALAIQEVQQAAQEIEILRASLRSSTAMLAPQLALLDDLTGAARVIEAQAHAQAAMASLLAAVTPWTL